MFPEVVFKLLEVVIVIAGPAEVPLALLSPIREKLLQGVPLPNKDLAFLSRFQRWRRLRTVAINTQRRNPSVFSRVIQRPPNFVFCSRVRRAAVRHLQTRTKRAAEARPKDTKYEIKSRRVRDPALIVSLWSKVVIFQKIGT